MSDVISSLPAAQQDAPECTTFDGSSQPGPDGLNERQMAAVEMIAAGRSFSATAQELKVDRATIFRWRQSALFQEAVQRRHDELWKDPLHGLVGPAIEVLAEHLENAYDRSRWRAASMVLRLAKLHRDR